MGKLVWTASVFALGAALSCGDSKTDETSDPEMIVYPDALCDSKACVANSDEAGTCDPDASDPALADCNAWQAKGRFSLQAIKIDASATRGRPMAPTRMDDDQCPENSKTPEGKTKHCCERVAEQGERPAFRLTSLQMASPPLFEVESVSSTSKLAIDEDRYNWIMELSSGEPGNIMIKTGLGLENEDGSFAFADGPFERGGQTWNQDGQWDPHLVPALLGADGSLRYAGQDVSPEFLVPLWDEEREFVMLVLPLTGVQLSIKLDADQLCAGYLTANQTFDSVGEISAHLPLDPLRGAHLVFEKGDHGTGLCPLTANVTPAECDKPVDEWGK